MRSLRVWVTFLCCAGLLLGASSGRAAGEEAERLRGGLTLKEYKSRLSKLRNAGGRWITQRKRFPSRCPLCQGAGSLVVKRRRGSFRRKCNQCDGMHAWLSKKAYRAVYFEMRTPAFRALSGIKETLGKQYDLARHGKPWPTKIDRYRLRERELVDDTHGIVWFLFNASKVPTATRWIWAKKGNGKKFAWFRHDSRSDGPWPEDVDEEEGPTGGGSWEPVEGAEAGDVRMAVATAQITFRAFESMRRGSTLRLRLKPWSDVEDRPLAERVGIDAIRLLRSVFGETEAWDVVEAEWRIPWRDAYGRVLLKTAWVSSMGRSAFSAAAWNTRSAADQVRLLDWEPVTHAGWEPVEPLPARPGPPPATPVEPPEAAEPEPPAPTPPTPTPPRPTPPRPTPPAPAPMEPEVFEMPTPNTKALRDGRKGIAHMEAIYKRAVLAHDEGFEAHQGGAHGLWQEKLAEARTHLAEIEETWLNEVVKYMPGDDEGTQDAVANEHFGEIWDTVYKLKAMVRKMSAAH